MYKPDIRAPMKREKRYLVLSLPQNLPRIVRNFSGIMALVVGSNLLSHSLLSKRSFFADAPASSASSLYLLDKAGAYIAEPESFGDKVKEVSGKLNIPPEWLMAVMYAESRFDPAVYNQKGSGAIGLIQFMPATARDMDVTPERLQRMSARQQMEYVYRYLQGVREKYGEYQSLTELYLAILFPKARGQDFCFTLYARPGEQYEMNAGLDSDKDGRVTVSDVDRHLKRLFPEAYMIQKVYEE
ncbi:MAG: transglycosylase [Bacteroidetes bacterium]|nr:MAG: transglycosylase [Bacteroidota bacterium]